MFSVETIGPAGLLAIVVILILLGRLVPRRSVDTTVPREMYDEMKEDRDRWRAANSQSEEARVLQGQLLSELIENSRTTVAFIKSFPAEGEPS
jgi:hypothetical protein